MSQNMLIIYSTLNYEKTIHIILVQFHLNKVKRNVNGI